MANGVENLKNYGQSNRQLDWINCAKACATFAVLIDHTIRVLYSNQHIGLASYYSAPLFVLISGYLCYGSNFRNNRSYGQTIIKSCKHIFMAYLLASFFYVIAENKYFDFQVYLNAIIHFNASSPFYYVSLYIQLMIVNKALYKLLAFSRRFRRMNEIIYDSFLGVIIIILAFITTNYTKILGVYGGGGRLLGGTFLVLFYIGMIFNKYNVFSTVHKLNTVLMFVIGGSAYLVWWRLMCNGYHTEIDSRFPFGEGFNPPSISLSFLALFMMFFCFGFFNICSWNNITNYVTKVIGWFGKHSLYIFLYHRLWYDYFLCRFVSIDNLQIRRIVYYTVMIFASIAMEYIVNYAKYLFNCVLCDSSVLNDK